MHFRCIRSVRLGSSSQGRPLSGWYGIWVWDLDLEPETGTGSWSPAATITGRVSSILSLPSRSCPGSCSLRVLVSCVFLSLLSSRLQSRFGMRQSHLLSLSDHQVWAIVSSDSLICIFTFPQYFMLVLLWSCGPTYLVSTNWMKVWTYNNSKLRRRVVVSWWSIVAGCIWIKCHWQRWGSRRFLLVCGALERCDGQSDQSSSEQFCLAVRRIVALIRQTWRTRPWRLKSRYSSPVSLRISHRLLYGSFCVCDCSYFCSIQWKW